MDCNAILCACSPVAVQRTLGVASDFMDISDQHDAMLDTAFGLMREPDTRKIYDYSKSFRGVCIAMSPGQVNCLPLFSLI
jgi:hypothetical protein